MGTVLKFLISQIQEEKMQKETGFLHSLLGMSVRVAYLSGFDLTIVIHLQTRLLQFTVCRVLLKALQKLQVVQNVAARLLIDSLWLAYIWPIL